MMIMKMQLSAAIVCCLWLLVSIAASGFGGATNNEASKRAVFYSEMKLRSVVERTNNDLRQLKRDFMTHATDIYLRLRQHGQLGYEVARSIADQPRWSSAQPKSAGPSAASLNVLIAEQFGEILIKKYVTERRLLTGLKLAFVKLLPMQTLVRLHEKYKAFSWLHDQSQVDLRPKFPNLQENQYVILYSLIELRARLRAADDIIILTTDNILRILQLLQHYLIESKHKSLTGTGGGGGGGSDGDEIDQQDLELLARHGSKVLAFYQDHILEYKTSLRNKYEAFLGSSQALVDAMLSPSSRPINQQPANGNTTTATTTTTTTTTADNQQNKRQLFYNFLDELINTEALDIDLNSEATGLDFPPTINQQMIDNIQAKWIPEAVLQWIEADRRLLIDERAKIKQLVPIKPDYEGADIAEWVAFLQGFICRYHNRY